MSPEIDHIAFANESLAKGLAFYCNLLGLDHHETEEVASQKVKAAILTAGSTRVELLEPTADDSPVARFLKRHGEGFHHIAFRVTDLEQTLAGLEQAGVRLIDTKARSGVGGTRIAFIHPSAASGVLIELVERPA